MAVSLRWKLFGALSAAILAAACGSDEKKDDNNQTADAGVTPADGEGGGANNPNPSGLPTLPANTAGKACTTDAECSGGTCSTQLLGGEATGTITSLAAVAGIRVEISGGPIPAGYCTNRCTSNVQCGAGGVCFGAAGGSPGECRKSCTASTECGTNQECATAGALASTLLGGGADAGVSQLPATCQGLPTVDKLTDQLGKSCTTQTATEVCGEGICALGVCTGVCAADGDCGAEGICNKLGLYGSVGTCAETCNTDQDCAAFAAGGIGCNDNNGVKTCGPKQFPLTAGVVGKACTAATEATDCGTSGDCATQLGLPPVAAPGGYCSLSGCADDTACGGGSCVSSIISRCYAKCAADGDCRSGYSCQDRDLVSGTPGKVCAPIPTPRDAGTAPTPVTPAPVDAGV